MEVECKSEDNSVPSSNCPVLNGNEPLGSVTQQPESEGGIQLRTSARVSKKLKLDSLAQISTDKKELNHEEERKVEVPVGNEGKPRAKRVDWSTEDKCAFFEALNEYGKDIDAIHNYIIQKAKRRGGQETKTKDQVRFFYYRMWSILSKHITFPSYLKKQTQELYALINFGELRKKISLSHKKHYEKLSEMIYSGSTQLKFRGKVRKLRTPLCKALRKINQIEESSEELRLPSCVTVELRPRYSEDWCRVQALAQNPRVRSVQPLHRRLESLLVYLQQRWQTGDHRLMEQLLSTVEAEEGEPQERENWRLHVGPKPGTHVTEPSVRLSETATSSKLSLLAYEERFHPLTKQVPTLLQQLPVIHRSKGRGVKRPRTDSLSDKVGMREGEDGGGGELVGGREATRTPGLDCVESTHENQLLTLNCITDNAQTEALLSPHVNGELLQLVSPEKVSEDVCLEQAHCGWTQDTAGAIRIGDIYMMFGVDSKIQLDYWWERCPPTEISLVTTSEVAGVTSASANLALALQKLLSVAKLQMFKSKGSSSNCIGADSKINSTKSRLAKPKTHLDGVQKVDTQLKFQVCPLPLDEVFRRPIIAPINSHKLSDNSNVHFEKMRPRYCNRRGRPRRLPPPQRSAQDVKPLLPKVPPSISLATGGLFSAVTGQGFKPIAPAPPPSATETRPAPITIDVKVASVSEVVGMERVPSPPSLSNLLDDLSLPSVSSSRLSTPVPTFEGLLGNEGNDMSPSLSKDQWINSEVADMSLSGFSFLHNMDTDIKNISEDSRLSDMDSQLRNLINPDNSTDLNDIIADLTATIKTDNEPD